MEPDHADYLATEFRIEDYERREQENMGRPINDIMICGQLPPSPQKSYSDLFNYYTGPEYADCDPFLNSFHYEPAEELWMKEPTIDCSWEEENSFETYDPYIGTVIRNLRETTVSEVKSRKRGRPRTNISTVKMPKLSSETGYLKSAELEEEVMKNGDNLETRIKDTLEPLAKKAGQSTWRLKYSLVAGLSMLNANNPIASGEVYRFAKHYFPGVVQGTYWKNSIRHAMCTSDIIMKVPSQRPQLQVTNEWTIKPEKREQFIESIKTLERDYPDTSTYGMSNPALWKAISQGAQGLPSADIFVDIGEPKRARRCQPEKTALEHALLQQRNPNVPPANRTKGPNQVRFKTLKPVLEFDSNLEALIDQLPLSPISMDNCDMYYDSPLGCGSPKKMDFGEIKSTSNAPLFSFD